MKTETTFLSPLVTLAETRPEFEGVAEKFQLAHAEQKDNSLDFSRSPCTANDLSSAFFWENTPDGEAYWRKVWKELHYFSEPTERPATKAEPTEKSSTKVGFKPTTKPKEVSKMKVTLDTKIHNLSQEKGLPVTVVPCSYTSDSMMNIGDMAVMYRTSTRQPNKDSFANFESLLSLRCTSPCIIVLTVDGEKMREFLQFEIDSYKTNKKTYLVINVATLYKSVFPRGKARLSSASQFLQASLNESSIPE